MNISLDHRVVRGKKTASRIIDGEAIVVTPENRMLHSLNKVGTRIWEIIKEEKRIRDIVDLICQEFEVSKDKAREDVLEFIQKLDQRQMVDIRP